MTKYRFHIDLDEAELSVVSSALDMMIKHLDEPNRNDAYSPERLAKAVSIRSRLYSSSTMYQISGNNFQENYELFPKIRK